jgi:hypothetical protein
LLHHLCNGECWIDDPIHRWKPAGLFLFFIIFLSLLEYMFFNKNDNDQDQVTFKPLIKRMIVTILFFEPHLLVWWSGWLKHQVIFPIKISLYWTFLFIKLERTLKVIVWGCPKFKIGYFMVIVEKVWCWWF